MTLDQMLEQKTLNARFTWGSDSYFVNIKTVTKFLIKLVKSKLMFSFRIKFAILFSIVKN